MHQQIIRFIISARVCLREMDLKKWFFFLNFVKTAESRLKSNATIRAFADEDKLSFFRWIKLSELGYTPRLHANFSRLPPSPAAFPSFSFFLFTFFLLLFRFTSRRQRSGQIRIHCRISPGTFAPKRGNCLLPRPPTSLNRGKTNEETDRNQEPGLLRISYNFSWFLLLPPVPGNFHFQRINF